VDAFDLALGEPAEGVALSAQDTARVGTRGRSKGDGLRTAGMARENLCDADDAWLEVHADYRTGIRRLRAMLAHTISLASLLPIEPRHQ
jgi:hypothetical protein